jgi:hypothetical protein
MDPRLVDQVLQLVLPVALLLLALNVGANMIGFGKSSVKRLTRKVVVGLLAIMFVWVLIVMLCQRLPR